jgi:hypothetical protein
MWGFILQPKEILFRKLQMDGVVSGNWGLGVVE